MKRTLDQLASEYDLKGKNVLVRVDFNVPLCDGEVEDDTRIQAALPTIHFLIEKGAKVILCSHLGRPQGARVFELSLAPVAKRLNTLLEKSILFLPDCIGDDVRKHLPTLRNGDVALLENLRFHIQESQPTEAFAKELSKLADFFVNDAFAVCHRKEASVFEVPKHFKKRCAIGFLVEKEMIALSTLFSGTKRPFAAVIGGAKISTKLTLLKTFLGHADWMMIGGAMANTFLKAEGVDIQESLFEPKEIEQAKEFLKEAKQKDLLVYLPIDAQCAVGDQSGIYPLDNKLPEGAKILDIGPETTKLWIEVLKSAKTTFWNGPVGRVEDPPYDAGSNNLAKALAHSPESVTIGGGDTLKVISKLGLGEAYTFLSTGGGATMAFLEEGSLPAIDAIE